ncbi:hypothetical protein M0R45_004568 [Rubus argutus]|uniref:FAD dependent oxidoreductase domain-containing protein n=1 Tax=Rubus argutus TaxID=59490 RepID=A0AAW1YK36_RUBAR
MTIYNQSVLTLQIGDITQLVEDAIRFHKNHSDPVILIADGPSLSPKRVVVCGGGVIGVCTAYFLAKNGAVVTLVEKSSVACAASGKAGGFLALIGATAGH